MTWSVLSPVLFKFKILSYHRSEMMGPRIFDTITLFPLPALDMRVFFLLNASYSIFVADGELWFAKYKPS